MKKDFFVIITAEPRPRGYPLEKFLRETLRPVRYGSEGLVQAGRRADRRRFTFDPNDFILETKWEEKPLARAPLDVFQAKVMGKLDNTLGLFISINGYSPEAIQTYSPGSRKLDGVLCRRPPGGT